MSELTITFLGTGTSQGVPVVGCTCEVCESGDPRDKRTRSSIYVETPEYTWVIDTGTDFRTQCLREKVTRLDAVVYTHSHTDHVMGFDDLRPFCFTDRLMPIYASRQTMGDLRRIFAFAFEAENQFPGYVRPDPRLVEGPFELGKTELTPLEVLHGRAHVYGYLFTRGGQKLAAYLSDCKVVPDEVVEKIKGVQVLIIDALRHRAHPTHMCVEEALEIARRTNPDETWFTHICHELAHSETEAALPPNVRMAYDGLKIPIRTKLGGENSQNTHLPPKL